MFATETMCKKYPYLNYIYELIDAGETYNYATLLQHIQHIYKLDITVDEKNDIVSTLFDIHHYYNDYPDSLSETLKESYIFIKQLSEFTIENERLEKENQRLSKENTELLLRPEGPVSIELAKKFIENGDKQQNM